MTSAPRPGAGKRKNAEASAQRTITITRTGDAPLVVAWNSLPLWVEARVRLEVGLPPQAFWNGADNLTPNSFKVMWWVARLVNGERELSLRALEAEWPDPFDPEQWDIQVDDGTEGGEDHPEE